MTPLEGQYEPSPHAWMRDQVAEYEASGGTRGNLQHDTGLPVVIVTMRGRRSGKLRKAPVMRVEHEGEYALIASNGGADTNPAWYANLVADPHIELQDGPRPADFVVREVHGEERAAWWARAVEAFPNYAGYQGGLERDIPVLVARRAT